MIDFDPTLILDRMADDVEHWLQTIASVLVFGIWCELMAHIFIGG